MKFGIRIPPPQMGPVADPDFIVRYSRLVESLGFESLWTIDHALMCVDHDGAVAELQQAVKDPRKKAEALFLLGRAFRGKGLADLAKNQLDKAFDATGGIHGQIGKEVAYELGAVAEGQGETGTALEHYQRILEQDIGYRDVDDKIQRLRS